MENIADIAVRKLNGVSNMEELKKCPFCGGEAKMKVNESTLITLIACPSCNVTIKNNFKGHKRIKKLLEELAIEAWNRRVEE